MKCILGINLKNVLIKKGPEHDIISAEVFMNDNKIGELVNDGWCEEYYIEFCNEELEKEFEARVKRYYKRKKIKELDYDGIIKELLFINKEYKSVKDTYLKCEQLTFLWN